MDKQNFKVSCPLFLMGGYCESPQPSSEPTLFDDLEHGSCSSDSQSETLGLETDNGLIRVCDEEVVYESIEKKLVSRLSSCGFNARVEDIRKYDHHSGIVGRARIQCFGVYTRAVGMKCGGNVNGKYAWFGGSKDEIHEILSNGFGFRKSNIGRHGLGVYLSPVDHPLESMRSAAPDEDGLKHMILCRVILGKAEVVRPGSEQSNPSSEEFDSGVDNLESPQKYIIWTSRMNTHILPEFIVSFRASSCYRGFQRRRPSSDWMPFSTLIAELSKRLPSDAVELIKKHHSDFKKQKMTRFEMVQQARHVAGDKLLMTIIKSYRGKV